MHSLLDYKLDPYNFKCGNMVSRICDAEYGC